jgi:hypothetical protein
MKTLFLTFTTTFPTQQPDHSASTVYRISRRDGLIRRSLTTPCWGRLFQKEAQTEQGRVSLNESHSEQKGVRSPLQRYCDWAGAPGRPQDRKTPYYLLHPRLRTVVRALWGAYQRINAIARPGLGVARCVGTGIERKDLNTDSQVDEGLSLLLGIRLNCLRFPVSFVTLDTPPHTPPHLMYMTYLYPRR